MVLAIDGPDGLYGQDGQWRESRPHDTRSKGVAVTENSIFHFFKNEPSLPRFVCYPPYCFCNFPFPRMGCSLVGGKGKSCRREILCYGIKGWIRQPVDENRGSIISIRVLIFARSWTSWRDASATVLCQKTVQLSRQRDAESAKWVMTSHF